MVVQFVFFFLSCAIFRENSAEMDVKTMNVMVKKQKNQIDNNYPWSVLLLTTEMSSFEHFDVISMVDKKADHG